MLLEVPMQRVHFRGEYKTTTREHPKGAERNIVGALYGSLPSGVYIKIEPTLDAADFGVSVTFKGEILSPVDVEVPLNTTTFTKQMHLKYAAAASDILLFEKTVEKDYEQVRQPPLCGEDKHVYHRRGNGTRGARLGSEDVGRVVGTEGRFWLFRSSGVSAAEP